MKRRSTAFTLASTLGTAGVFILDLRYPGASVGGMLYVVPVLLTEWGPGWRWTGAVTAVCTALVTFGPLFALNPATVAALGFERLLSIILIWATGGILVHSKMSREGSWSFDPGDADRSRRDSAPSLKGATVASEARKKIFKAREVERVQGLAADQAVGLARQMRELEESRDAALESARLKSEFLANMSHEIRSPMTAILGFTDEALEDLTRASATDEVRRALLTIKRNGEHLLEIINDILDLSKIEADRITIDRVPCSPSEILVDVAWLMRSRALEKRLKLEVEFEGPVPETIQTDPTRLRQVLINLASNAIKFTERGGVKLRARSAGCGEPGGGKVIFEVIDTGIGISPEQKRRIFEAFSQADSATTRKFGGTGLGLTISRRLAGLLGGDIAVEGELGRGSVFRVSVATGPLEGIPMIEAPRGASIAHESESPARAESIQALAGRVLLAEDGPDNQRLIARILAKVGIEVEVADTGRIAYEKAMAASVSGEPFDLILMDMQMPELDGYGATSMLRQAGYGGPIIALTAHAMAGDREKCIEAGCDDYTSKPIRRGELLGLVAYFLEKGSPAG